MKRTSKDFDVIVGLNSSINGDVVSEGSVRIDGKVSGSINAKGDVIIGDNAIVDADVEANYCEISGKVNGSVHSDTLLKIFKSGELNGDITVSSFTIEEGGIFRGNCDINPDSKEKKIKTDKPVKKEEQANDKNTNKNTNNQTNNNRNNKQNNATNNNNKQKTIS